MSSITQENQNTITPRFNKPEKTPKPRAKISALRHPLLSLLVKRLNDVDIDSVRLELNDGTTLSIGSTNPDTPQPHVRLHSFRAILRGWSSGLMGWAEGYMAGDWDVSDTRDITHWAMANEQKLESAFGGSTFTNMLNRLWHKLNDNSLRGSRRNIQYHYDLGNAFYRLWLDGSMTYSAALFESAEQDLPSAQRNKYERIIELAEIEDGHNVLEIGCGWGGFADVLLEKYRTDYHGVTLSDEQLEWAKTLIEKRQYQNAHFTLTDYRELDTSVDRVVSIEMFEAVGEAHWQTYFDKLKQCLKPGGVAVLQVITIDESRYDIYRSTPDFIQKYIFPGGMLPTPTNVRALVESNSMTLGEEVSFGKDYARTLQIWHEAFLNAWPEIATQGFDQRFYRMWRYYLAYCEAGFNTESIDVRLFQIRNTPVE